MPLETVDAVSPSPAIVVGTKLSRRRPGRRDDVAPSLIPLLRGSVSLDSSDWDPTVAGALTMSEDLEMMADDLAPACGVIFGAALSASIWALLGCGVYFLLH